MSHTCRIPYFKGYIISGDTENEWLKLKIKDLIFMKIESDDWNTCSIEARPVSLCVNKSKDNNFLIKRDVVNGVGLPNI